MAEMEVILRRFGDEQSTLLDQFERHSFEVQLNQAILGRSLSESSVSRRRTERPRLPPPPPRTQRPRLPPPPELLAPPPPSQPPLLASQVQQSRQRHRGVSGFQKILKMFLKPIFTSRGGRKNVPDTRDPRSWKAISSSSRSMRV